MATKAELLAQIAALQAQAAQSTDTLKSDFVPFIEICETSKRGKTVQYLSLTFAEGYFSNVGMGQKKAEACIAHQDLLRKGVAALKAGKPAGWRS
jgi:hypothetical protein